MSHLHTYEQKYTLHLDPNPIFICKGYIPNLGPLGPLLHVENFVVGGWCVNPF